MPRPSLSNILTYFVTVISLCLSVGCADDLRNRSVFDGGAGDAVIGFSVENVKLTRDGDGVDKESAIDHAYLLFYDSGASLETEAPVAAVRAEIDAEDSGRLKFKMPLRLESNTDYQLMAIANADGYVPSGFDSFGDYLDSWCRSVSGEKEGLHLWRHGCIVPESVDFLPMRGGVAEGSAFRFTSRDGAYVVPISLTFRRMVARIDVANIVREGFEVEEVALCNWRDKVSIASFDNEAVNAAGQVCGILSEEADGSDDILFQAVAPADDAGIQQLQKSVYCFPSVSYRSNAADRESVALIIKARYGDDADASYYRVNVNASGNKSEIRANTKYLVTIRSVKGRGAPTAEEAYSAAESQVVLSVVEDWDLEGNFAMDDEGNFLVLSTGKLDFEGSKDSRKEVKVLSSKGLSWDVDYIPDDDASADAFRATILSGSSLIIEATGENTDGVLKSGKFTVSARTPGDGILSVDIRVTLTPSAEGPVEPVIPSDMPFALVPEDNVRVKIDHEQRTIEIDGFDPDCFNSFIDVPFKVYVNEKQEGVTSVNVTTDLLWPLEGRVSSEISAQYSYCVDSFLPQGEGKVTDSQGSSISHSDIAVSSFQAYKDHMIYISIGAMAPDDPAVRNRYVTISGADGTSISYAVTIRPCAAIMDDVVISDDSGNRWLVMDRNIQDFDKTGFTQLIGRAGDGSRHQAYNYSRNYTYNQKKCQFIIPFKYLDAASALMEEQHELYLGKTYRNATTGTSMNKNTLAAAESVKGSRLYWLKKYCFSGDMPRMSPFYEPDEGSCGFSQWVIPDRKLIDCLCKKISVAKMRMFWVSEVDAVAGGASIPVCCYLPYECWEIGDDSGSTYGYCTAEDGNKPDAITVIYFDEKECLAKSVSSPTSNHYFLCRLVRKLTSDELELYKTGFLGYPSGQHRLSICHPDTYESVPYGWSQY